MANAALERDWTALPQTILQLFGRHLSAPGLKHALQSCKPWREPVRHGVESFAVSFPAPDPADQQQADTDGPAAAAQKLAQLASTFPKLRQLQATFFSEPDACLVPVASLAESLPAVQELRLCYQPEEGHHSRSRSLHQVLAPLAQLRQLTSLHLETHTEFSDWSWLHSIAALTQLSTLVLRLNLRAPSSALDLTALQPLASLQHFELRLAFSEPPSGAPPDTTVSKEALQTLSRSWPQLQSLSLTASPWDFAPSFCSGLSHFRALEALCLSVEDPYEYGGQPPAPPVGVQLGSLPDGLLAARLANARVVDSAAAPGGSPPQLRILELLGCEYDKAALAASLRDCSGLTSMVVDRVVLADEALARWLQQQH